MPRIRKVEPPKENQSFIAAFLGNTASPSIRMKDGLPNRSHLAHYAGRPLDYFKEVLKIPCVSPAQAEIATKLEMDPHFVLARSGNSVGKSYIAAAEMNYMMDCFDPCVIVSSGPTEAHIKDILWGNIRLQRQLAGLSTQGLYPSNPKWFLSEDHQASGINVGQVEAYKGRHRPRMSFFIDEATALPQSLWKAIDTMFDKSMGSRGLAIYNPTERTSAAYMEEMAAIQRDGSRKRHVVGISALDHPNIIAELQGRSPPIPGAVSLSMLEGWLDTCEEIPEKEFDVGRNDFKFPPPHLQHLKRTRCYRPGQFFMSAGLGLWADVGDSVWSALALKQSLADLVCHCGRKLTRANCPCGEILPFPITCLPMIGADMATGRGDDWFAAMARWGPWALFHESSQTMDPIDVAGVLAEMMDMCAALARAVMPTGKAPVQPGDILVNIDGDMTGNAVRSILQRLNLHANCISSAQRPTMQAGSTGLPSRYDYPNMRSQLWFETADKGKVGAVLLGGLPQAVRDRIQMQAMGVKWKRNLKGQHEVEDKQVTKDRIGRSPDDMDACNLCWHDKVGFVRPRSTYDNWQPPPEEPRTARQVERGLYRHYDEESAQKRRGLYGLGR